MSLKIVEEIKKLSPERRDLLERLLKKEAPQSARAFIVPRLRKSNQVPVSFAQQRHLVSGPTGTWQPRF